MGIEKLAGFYADPIKRVCDENSAARSFHLRLLSTDKGLAWTAQRLARFGAQVGLSALTRARALCADFTWGPRLRRNPAAS